MQLYELKQELKNKKLKNLYIFNGLEAGLRDIYVKKIVDCAKTPLLHTDTIKSILSSLQNYSLFHDRTIYYISGDKDILEAENMWSGLKQIDGPVIVILVFDNLRKTSKFYKFFEKEIVDFDRMTVEQLSKLIKKELNLSDRFANILAELCERDYSRLLLECNKLKHFIQAYKYDNQDQAFIDAVNSGLIYQGPKDVIFELVNDVLNNSKNKAFENLKEYKELNDNPIGLFSLLYSNFRQLLMVQGLDSKQNIADRTGLTGFQVKLAIERSGIYTLSQIVKALEVLQDMDTGIKTGAIEADIAAELALCMILK